jgi:hypothetical protein
VGGAATATRQLVGARLICVEGRISLIADDWTVETARKGAVKLHQSKTGVRVCLGEPSRRYSIVSLGSLARHLGLILASSHPPASAPAGVCSGGKTALSELPVILVVEDDQAIQGVIEDTLSEGGFEVAIAASGEEAATLRSGDKASTRHW